METKRIVCDTCNEVWADVQVGFTYRCGMCSMRSSEKIGLRQDKVLEEASPKLIKAAIKKEKLTYKDLSFKLSVPESSLGQMARGSKVPSSKLHKWVFNVLSEKDIKQVNLT